MSHLQTFSEKVVAQATNTQPESLNEAALGIDFVAILKMIELIGTIITELTAMCPNQAVGMKASIKKPNWLQKVKFRFKVIEHARASGISKAVAMSGKLADACIDIAGKMTEDEISKIILEAEPTDNLLI